MGLYLPENLLYVKTIQNNTPMVWVYKISVFDGKETTDEKYNTLEQKVTANEKKLREISNQISKKIEGAF